MKRLALFLLLTGLLSLSAALVMAQDDLHPSFPLLDVEGVSVLESGAPVSTAQTCGTCHDTAFIAQHSAHADLGYSLAGTVEGDRPWESGFGWYGGWSPVTYGQGEPTPATWVRQFGWRHVGGGPADAVGVEMNCFICHTTDADNSARVAALEGGQFAWASTATLNGSGIVSAEGSGWAFNEAAFDASGALLPEFVKVGAPDDANCGFCHGVVDASVESPLAFDPFETTQWETLTTGQVFSPDRISSSGMNLADKAELSRSWDVHAERVVECVDCHYSLNNPIFYAEPDDSRPDHLKFDPRRMDFDEYLQRPLHQFANGGAAYVEAFPVFEQAERDCASCHDAVATHTWLEYAQRHMDTLACESCHIPELYAPALAAIDWTVLTAEGQPRTEYRGVDTTVEPAYIYGYQPILLPDADQRLAPYNVISAWYWVSGDLAQPVSRETLRTAYFDGDGYAADVLAAFDADSDGALSESELIIDSEAKQALIAGRLVDLGLTEPRIAAESEAYAIHHNVTHGQWAIRECSTCHTEDSRLNTAFLLSSSTPGGVQPTLIGDPLNGEIAGGDDDLLYYQPSLDVGENGLYILGHHSIDWVHALGVLIFVGSAFGVMVHAGLRVLVARRLPKPEQAELKEVYMYSIYERQWHWLQTAVIFGLIFTGMVIHKPDLFGMFSFRGVVLVHNALALLLIINAALAAFYHLVSGEIRQFLPEPRGFFGQMFAQARYYAYGIFRGEPHPFEKTRHRKLNPIQQLTYFGLLNVLLPLQVITGVLMWGAQRFPALTDLVGGLPLLGPAHTLNSWLLATFIVVHVYMTTTGHMPLTNLRAMIFGWDEVEAHSPAAGD